MDTTHICAHPSLAKPAPDLSAPGYLVALCPNCKQAALAGFYVDVADAQQAPLRFGRVR